MPNSEILAGRNLLTERPVPDQRFHDITSTSGDFTNKPVFVGITYDTRHTDADGSPLMVLADDANRRILYCNSTTMLIVVSFPYPRQINSSLTAFEDRPTNKCYGIATLNEPDDCLLAFLSEPQGLDSDGETARYPILYYLRYNPQETDQEKKLVVEKWAVVDAGHPTNTPPASYTQCTDTSNTEFGKGMSEYHNDLLVVGKWKGVQTILTMDYHGQPLAHHPSFSNPDKVCGVQYINGRTYTTIDRSSDPDIGGRILAKFLTEQMDISRMVPLMSIEPFFLGPAKAEVLAPNDDTSKEERYFGPDITIFQDRMGACYLDNVYTYRMAYLSFICNGVPNDDIDLGSVLIGDYKIQKVIVKNIADVYKMRNVTLTIDDSVIAATKPKLKEAAKWVFLTATDPATETPATDIVQMAEQNASTGTLPTGTIWAQSIALATEAPYIEPDGERAIWIGVGIPETYQSGTIQGETVGVDDSPFIVPLTVRAKLG